MLAGPRLTSNVQFAGRPMPQSSDSRFSFSAASENRYDICRAGQLYVQLGLGVSTMNANVARGTLLCGLSAIVLGALVGVASSFYRQAGDDRVYAFSKPTATDLPPVLAPAGRTREPLRPRLAIDQGTSYDFGIMSRNEQRSHTFAVRNVGNAPLSIRFVDKSCMCTEVTMTRTEVPAGETTEITLTWQPSTFKLDFQQTARFETNDPSRIELDLTVQGKVQQVVQTTPRSLNFDGVAVGQEREQDVFVFAYRDPDLVVDQVELLDPETAPFFETEIRPADDAALAAETGAVAGQQIIVRLKPGLPLGRSYQRLRLHLNKPNLGPLEVPVIATLVGNVTVWGPGYDAGAGFWNLGKLSGDHEHTKTLWIFVRGEHADQVQLSVASLDPSDVMQAELTSNGSTNGIAKHALKLTIRPEGRVINQLGSEQGDLAEIVIATTDPEAPEIRIPVAFAVETQP